MGRSGSYLNNSITSAWSEHSLDPEDIRVSHPASQNVKCGDVEQEEELQNQPFFKLGLVFLELQPIGAGFSIINCPYAALATKFRSLVNIPVNMLGCSRRSLSNIQICGWFSQDELKKLYAQLEVYKCKKMLANNPHLHKKRNSKKGLGRSLMKRITEIPENMHIHRQCSREDGSEHGSNRSTLRRNPFESGHQGELFLCRWNCCCECFWLR